jgi:predicted esterase
LEVTPVPVGREPLDYIGRCQTLDGFPGSHTSRRSVKEEHIEVPRTARFFTQGAAAAEAAEIWYVCHGYRQLARRFLRRFSELGELSRLVVAPEGLSRFYLEGGEGREHEGVDRIGASWMTRDDRLNDIKDYVRYLDLVRVKVEFPIGREVTRVVLGFSQGVHTACRWVALGEIRPSALILWGAYLPADLPEGAIDTLNQCQITIVRGKADIYVTDEKHAQQVQRLRDMGLHFHVVEHGGGHELDSDTLRGIARAVSA